MQSHDSATGSTGNRLSPFPKPSMNGDGQGFPQTYQSFHNSRPSMGYGERHPDKARIPSINTAGQTSANMHLAAENTPGTGMDMNFTPLLPSQLLLGSPFQPGSPSAFASPQFQQYSQFTQVNAQSQSAQAQLSGLHNQQQQLSPTLYSSFLSPQSASASQFFGGIGSPTSGYGLGTPGMGGLASAMQMSPGLMNSTSRTVYLGNIPPETSAEEILGHVRSGQIESVRLLPDKNCAFISFIDGSSATHFHSDAILKKLTIKGQDIKVGWGKPSQVPTSVALAVQQSGASRNVYLGQLPENISEDELRQDLGKFGAIDTVKIVREKSIAFVHFLSIASAIKAVAQLPQEPNWQPPRRVYYGKDRCAYVSKTQQQNAAQYLGIPAGYSQVLNGVDREMISNALAQQSVAAAAVATSAGGVNNLGNRTVYLGNIHPETTIEEICNVVRGGLLHHVRYIPDKHICFVTFIDPTSAASFYALSQMQGLMIHNRRLKIGWGKHSGALPAAIALAVSGGASRNVYVGNLDESWSEDRLRQDFSEYGEIELVNTLREKSCAFVNFTNIANAIKAIEAMRGREEYKRFKINFGKDRCGNPPRQPNSNQNQQNSPGAEGLASPPINGLQPSRSPQGLSVSPTGSNAHSASSNQYAAAPQSATLLSAGSTTSNPLIMYLQQQAAGPNNGNGLESESPLPTLHEPPTHSLPSHHSANSSMYLSQPDSDFAASVSSAPHIPSIRSAGLDSPTYLTPATNSGFSNHAHSQSHHTLANGLGSPGSQASSAAPTIGGLLAPNSLARGAQHNRAVSLPAFGQGEFGQAPPGAQAQGQGQYSGLPQQNGTGLRPAYQGHQHQHSALGGSSFGGFAGLGGSLGLGVQADQGLNGWAEEEVGAQ